MENIVIIGKGNEIVGGFRVGGSLRLSDVPLELAQVLVQRRSRELQHVNRDNLEVDKSMADDERRR